MIFYYDQQSGQVCGYSQEEGNKFDFAAIELEITVDDIQKIESNQYNLYIKNDQLILELKPEIEKRVRIANLKQKLENGTAVLSDISELLLGILN